MDPIDGLTAGYRDWIGWEEDNRMEGQGGEGWREWRELSINSVTNQRSDVESRDVCSAAGLRDLSDGRGLGQLKTMEVKDRVAEMNRCHSRGFIQYEGED